MSLWTHESLITPVGRHRQADPALQVQIVGVGGQLLLLAALWASVGLGPIGIAAGLAFAAITCATLVHALRRTPGRRPGPADQVTLARAVLVGGVTALVADRIAMGGVLFGDILTGGMLSGGLLNGGATVGETATGVPAGEDGSALVALVLVATVALVLDAVDGQVARRTGTSSPLGARFDMEVDAFLILVLSIHLAGTVGAWVLTIGLMRYAFVLAAWPLPWLRAALPPSRMRKTVAATQGIALVVAASGVLSSIGTVTVVALALATLLWSFGRDVLWLSLHRACPGCAGAQASCRRAEARVTCD